MTALDERRLHGIAVYNPDLLSKQELVAQFVARRELFAEMVADLRRPKFKQHQLIVGHRGMGKTTLLRRLRYAVEDDPDLSSRWIALAFPEEQYNVSRLSDLYLNCIDALGDALERKGQQAEADALDEAREELPDDDEGRRAAAALDLLLGTARRLKRRLLLLVDNLDLILERLKTEHWTIRELLSREDRLLLIGATPFVIGATYEYDAPFYDFFRVHDLRGLSFEETSEVLATLAGEMHAPDVERLVRDEPARIRTLHVLAGGNPRTIVLLFSVLAHGTEGDVRSDLEKLLDQTTPLYKARFEALPAQAQQVVDALAIHWDPISAAELADKLRLDVNTVSSQLNRLAQQGVVEKVPYDPSTKTGFQIAERFFNIWYLMRASRRVRRRLTRLVQFLRLFYGLEQLQVKARDLLRSQPDAMPLRQAELCLAIAEALDQDRTTRLALESRAIKAMLATDDLRREMPGLFDLDGEDAELRPVIDRQTWAREYKAIIDGAPDPETSDLLRLIGTAPVAPQEKLRLARSLSGMPTDRVERLRRGFTTLQNNLRRMFGTDLMHQFETAVLEGYVVGADDADALGSASAALNKPALELVSDAQSVPPERLQSIAHATDEPLAWAAYALSMIRMGRESEGEEALLRISEGESGMFARSFVARAHHGLGRQDSAVSITEQLLREALTAAEHSFAGSTFAYIGEYGKAREVFETALAQWPNNPTLLRRYADLLRTDGRFVEAQQAFERLIAIEPGDASTWSSLAETLIEQDKYSEALEAIEQGLQRQQSPYLSALHVVVLVMLDRNTDAAQAADAISLSESTAGDTILALHTANLMLSVVPWERATGLFRAVLPRLAVYLNQADVAEPSMELFASIAQMGHAARAADLIEELGLRESLRPVFEALRIHATGNRDALKRLSPELRDPVVKLLDSWPGTEASSPPKITATKRKRTNRKPSSRPKRR